MGHGTGMSVWELYVCQKRDLEALYYVQISEVVDCINERLSMTYITSTMKPDSCKT